MTTEIPLRYWQCAKLHRDPLAATIFSAAERNVSNLILTVAVPNGQTLLELAELLGPMIVVLKVQFSIVYDPTDTIKHTLQYLSEKHDFIVVMDRDLGRLVKWKAQDIRGANGPTRAVHPSYDLLSTISCSMHTSKEMIDVLSSIQDSIRTTKAEGCPLVQMKPKTPLSQLRDFGSPLFKAARVWAKNTEITSEWTSSWGFVHFQGLLPLLPRASTRPTYLFIIPPGIAGHGASAWATPRRTVEVCCPREQIQQGRRFFPFQDGNLSKEGLCFFTHAIRLDCWHISRGDEFLRKGPIPVRETVNVESAEEASTTVEENARNSNNPQLASASKAAEEEIFGISKLGKVNDTNKNAQRLWHSTGEAVEVLQPDKGDEMKESAGLFPHTTSPISLLRSSGTTAQEVRASKSGWGFSLSTGPHTLPTISELPSRRESTAEGSNLKIEVDEDTELRSTLYPPHTRSVGVKGSISPEQKRNIKEEKDMKTSMKHEIDLTDDKDQHHAPKYRRLGIRASCAHE